MYQRSTKFALFCLVGLFCTAAAMAGVKPAYRVLNDTEANLYCGGWCNGVCTTGDGKCVYDAALACSHWNWTDSGTCNSKGEPAVGSKAPNYGCSGPAYGYCCEVDTPAVILCQRAGCTWNGYTSMCSKQSVSVDVWGYSGCTWTYGGGAPHHVP